MKMIFVLSAMVLTLMVSGVAFAGGPIGYPWSSWGEISQGEEGLKIDGYAEQGIDWTRLGKTGLVLNTFAGLRFTLSDRPEDTWNNKYGPWLGVKLRRPLNLFSDWGELDIGIRFEGGESGEMKTTGFLQWSFGGNLKK